MLGRIVTAAVYTVFLLLEQKNFDRKMLALFPDPQPHALVRRILERIGTEIQSYIWLKTVVSAATAVASYAVLRAVRLDLAAFLALLAFGLNYIPYIGPWLSVLLPAFLALVQFDTLTPFLVTTIGLAIIQFSGGYIIEPRLMGTGLNVSPVFVLMSLALWGSIWGVVGMFLAVPMMVVVMRPRKIRARSVVFEGVPCLLFATTKSRRFRSGAGALLEHFLPAPEIPDDRNVDGQDDDAKDSRLPNDLVQLDRKQRARCANREPARPWLSQIEPDALRPHQGGVSKCGNRQSDFAARRRPQRQDDDAIEQAGGQRQVHRPGGRRDECKRIAVDSEQQRHSEPRQQCRLDRFEGHNPRQQRSRIPAVDRRAPSGAVRPRTSHRLTMHCAMLRPRNSVRRDARSLLTGERRPRRTRRGPADC